VTPDFIAPFSEKQGAPSAPSPPSASVWEAYRELIEQGLARGRNGKAIWQDLVSDHGFAGGYQAVKRFVRTLRGPQCPEAAGIILTAAGEEAQVDYGRHGLFPVICVMMSVIAILAFSPYAHREAQIEDQYACF
jgi:transposase